MCFGSWGRWPRQYLLCLHRLCTTGFWLTSSRLPPGTDQRNRLRNTRQRSVSKRRRLNGESLTWGKWTSACHRCGTCRIVVTVHDELSRWLSGIWTRNLCQTGALKDASQLIITMANRSILKWQATVVTRILRLRRGVASHGLRKLRCCGCPFCLGIR